MEAKGAQDKSAIDSSLGVAGQLLSNHISLLAIELEEARHFYWRSLVLLALCVGSGILFFILLTVFIIIEFWSTDYRMVVVLCLLGGSFFVTLMSALILVYWRKKTVLFSAIKEELIKDRALFHDQ